MCKFSSGLATGAVICMCAMLLDKKTIKKAKKMIRRTAYQMNML